MAGKPISWAHYIWAFGHILVLLGSLFSLLGMVTFSFRPRWYRIAYSGAIVSWGIVCYKSLGIPSASRAWVHKALMDENVQYLLLAFTWYMQAPIYLTLIPFATFSLFHTLTFVRTTLLPKPAPAASAGGSSASASSQQQSAGLSRTLQVWIKNNYERAMLFVAYAEAFVIMPRLTLGAVLFFTPLRASLFAPLFYAHFLRLRYYLSPQTKAVFRTANAWVDRSLLANQAVPLPVKKGITYARSAIATYANSILPGEGAPAPAAAAAGGNGGRPSEGGRAR